jgi:hypothetical protein
MNSDSIHNIWGISEDDRLNEVSIDKSPQKTIMDKDTNIIEIVRIKPDVLYCVFVYAGLWLFSTDVRMLDCLVPEMTERRKKVSPPNPESGPWPKLW